MIRYYVLSETQSIGMNLLSSNWAWNEPLADAAWIGKVPDRYVIEYQWSARADLR